MPFTGLIPVPGIHKAVALHRVALESGPEQQIAFPKIRHPAQVGRPAVSGDEGVEDRTKYFVLPDGRIEGLHQQVYIGSLGQFFHRLNDLV
jgi:hypothetical protein